MCGADDFQSAMSANHIAYKETADPGLPLYHIGLHPRFQRFHELRHNIDVGLALELVVLIKGVT
ncbi:hypothetical protein SAMN05444714_2812 [Yoonia litorea]|uniref:Uncharacterized protein n=1 Tax=Yoonia litorea TaxID=1123755 RepID=A0A1I6N0J1_9RHOB|nr:hypothetical protein SAMN05444714_2812 [Yoonia litorea]